MPVQFFNGLVSAPVFLSGIFDMLGTFVLFLLHLAIVKCAPCVGLWMSFKRYDLYEGFLLKANGPIF